MLLALKHANEHEETMRIWPLNRTTMDNKMGSNKVFVNVVVEVNEVNEEDVGDE